jgi:CRISPR/Cas system endoribonuclease Cas6 (RAMP superfamily)
VEYWVESVDEWGVRLFRIGTLLGAGSKPSFGFGFFRVVDSV